MTLNLGSQSQMLGEFAPVFTGNKKKTPDIGEYGTPFINSLI
jgi:hypothetical protein